MTLVLIIGLAAIVVALYDITNELNGIRRALEDIAYPDEESEEEEGEDNA